MTAIGQAVIVGGGIAGMATAIVLRRAGTAVMLIDHDPNWRVSGAGITLTGPTLRAFRQLGMLDSVMSEGHTTDGVRVCAVSGEIIRTIATPPLPGGDGVPGAGGILRPVLHKILREMTLASGTEVRLGLSVESITQDAAGVALRLTDGSATRADLVVGADGVFSHMRGLVFPQADRPLYAGQACWRLLAARPREIDRRHFFLGGPVKVGLTPVSADEMYLFLLEQAAQRQRIADADLPARLRHLLDGYGGVLAGIRTHISPTSPIVHRPLDSLLLPPPWHDGRIVLIGDATHAATPQLASGAGMAVEDALVLGAELRRAATIEDAFRAFTARRYERCRLVVENSLEIGRLEVARAPAEAQAAIVERSLAALARPI